MIIFTAIANYGISDIRTFVFSLNKSGYTDKKIALIYNLSDDTKEFLKLNGWELYEGVLSEHIILQRFKDAYYLLKNINANEELIWLDIKDVIFQKNPKQWIVDRLHKNGKTILAFSECVKLKDDDWATVNCGTSFPMEWEFIKNNVSYCAGTIAGKSNAIADLFIEIYRWARTTSNPQQLSDQAAYNVLLYLNHFKNTVDFVPQEDGFLTNLGTVLIKKDYFGNNLLEKTPLYENNKFINPETNDEFYIVHQYDRNPYIKEKIINAYLD
jgi:hypothetical protein